MGVYYITLLLITILGAFAQTTDRPYPLESAENRIGHTRVTGVLFFLISALLVLVAGLRYRVGTDYGAYYFGYGGYAQSLLDAFLHLEEPGYPLLCRIAILLGGSGILAVFLASLVTIYPALRVIYRHTDKLLLATLLFVFFGCWDGSFNGVRQYLAATMLFCGYDALENRKLFRYLIWVFIAFLFHRSAIVMAAMYFAVHQKMSLKNAVILFLGTLSVFLAYNRVLVLAGWITESEYTFENDYTAHAVNRLRVLASIMPTVVFLILYRYKAKTERETFWLNLLIIHAALRVATMNSALLYRIGIYTTLFQTVAIPELLKGISPNSRKVLTFFIVVLFAIFWWYEVSKSDTLNQFQWTWERLS